MDQQSRSFARSDGTIYQARIVPDVPADPQGSPQPGHLQFLTAEGEPIVSIPLTTALRLDRLDDRDLERMLSRMLGESREVDADGSESGFGELEGG